MALISRKVYVQIDPTPEELAEVFCDMSSEKQAKFFNHIAEFSKNWTSPFPFQMQSVASEGGLSKDGRHIMKIIGDYSQEQT